MCPAYDPKAGFEIAGFVWFQGWNDMVDRGTYPDRGKPGGYDAYSTCMAHFIRDVRRDLDAPKLPVVIGVMGVGGPLDPSDRHAKTHGGFREAMAAPAAMPEFRRNVVAVRTAPFWDAKLQEIADLQELVRAKRRQLKSKHKDGPNADGSMSEAEQKAYMDKYSAEVLGAENEAIWQRGASNAAYHYLGLRENHGADRRGLRHGPTRRAVASAAICGRRVIPAACALDLLTRCHRPHRRSAQRRSPANAPPTNQALPML